MQLFSCSHQQLALKTEGDLASKCGVPVHTQLCFHEFTGSWLDSPKLASSNISGLVPMCFHLAVLVHQMDRNAEIMSRSGQENLQGNIALEHAR